MMSHCEYCELVWEPIPSREQCPRCSSMDLRGKLTAASQVIQRLKDEIANLTEQVGERDVQVTNLQEQVRALEDALTDMRTARSP